MTDIANLTEQMAQLEHEQWCTWASRVLAEEPGISAGRRSRWQADMVPYADLPDDRKELDRTWARRALALILTEQPCKP